MSTELASKTYSRPLRDVRRESQAKADRTRNGLCNAEKARAIFLSLDDQRTTAKTYGVSHGLVAAIWTRARWWAATVGLKRPTQEAIDAHRGPRVKRKSPRRLEIEAFVVANAEGMTAIEMADVLKCTAHHVRLIGRELRIAMKSPPPPPLPNGMEICAWAHEDYEPVEPLPLGSKLAGWPGSQERIEALADRVAKGQPLWDDDTTPCVSSSSRH